MKLPRILLSAPASGSGKTMITCGLLQAVRDRGLRPVSFKCGPDYIDPMFHRTVLETPSRNLDTYFTDEDTTRYLMMRGAVAAQADIAIVEGVMGYYDGLAGISEKASAYDVSRVTQTPTILIVNCKGMSLSVAALIKGFMTYREGGSVSGVILNRMSGMLYPRISREIEQELGIPVLGYVPETDLLKLESRHLGLVMPSEMPQLREQIRQLGALLEKTLNIDSILQLADTAPDIEGKKPETGHVETGPVIAAAMDEAFCFYYEDNLALLEETGAKIIRFSPLHDSELPVCDGLILGGGYPELHVKQLSENASMRRSVKKAVTSGLPTMAECGGFMYLLEEMEDMNGTSYPAAGVLQGRAFRTDRLQRFGYMELRRQADAAAAAGTENEGDAAAVFGMDLKSLGGIRGHEFHYFDTTDNGAAFLAEKPLSGRSWACVHAAPSMLAGFPHLYYYSCPKLAEAFVKACAAYAADRKEVRQ